MARRDKKALIMQAAERLFTSRRLHEITMDDVAAAAGVGKGTIYRYFPDKDELFFATATGGFEELCALIQRRVPRPGSFEARLSEAGRQIAAFFDRRRQLIQMMMVEEARMPFCRGRLKQRWIGQRRKLLARITDIIRQGVREKAVRADIPPAALGSFFLALLRVRGRELVDMPEWVRRPELVVELFFRGARREGSPGAVVGERRRRPRRGRASRAGGRVRTRNR